MQENWRSHLYIIINGNNSCFDYLVLKFHCRKFSVTSNRSERIGFKLDTSYLDIRIFAAEILQVRKLVPAERPMQKFSDIVINPQHLVHLVLTLTRSQPTSKRRRLLKFHWPYILTLSFFFLVFMTLIPENVGDHSLAFWMKTNDFIFRNNNTTLLGIVQRNNKFLLYQTSISKECSVCGQGFFFFFLKQCKRILILNLTLPDWIDTSLVEQIPNGSLFTLLYTVLNNYITEALTLLIFCSCIDLVKVSDILMYAKCQICFSMSTELDMHMSTSSIILIESPVCNKQFCYNIWQLYKQAQQTLLKSLSTMISNNISKSC